MGGSTNSTTQATGTPLQQLFAGSQGYQQMAIPQIQAPQYPTATALTPAQAAQNTVSAMLTRTPVVAPVAASGGPDVKSTSAQRDNGYWGGGRNR